MADEKQKTLPGVPEAPPENRTDRAIRAVRDYQAGKATTAFLRSTLIDLPSNSLLFVSLASRVPVATLEKLRALKDD